MRLPLVVFCLLLMACVSTAGQTSNTNAGKAKANANSGANRKPIFRATADQIKQAQVILKQRNLYPGQQTGKLDDATRAGLKQYQQAESLKATGTLNKVTLEKMGITLTDKQRVM